MKIKKGSVDVITYFNLVDSAAGTPETALTITNIDATYTRAQAAAVKNDLTALAATTTAHTDNKGIEVDATNAPGLYRVDWPDAAFASGADKVILTVTCSGCAPAHLIVELVDYEPADVQAILGALTTSASAGDPGTTTTLTAYLKQIINTLEGSAGIPTFPAAAVAANNVSLAETIRSIDSRLPAALSSGNLKADVFAIQTDAITAASLSAAGVNKIRDALVIASLSPSINVGELGYTLSVAAAFAAAAATDTATLVGRLSSARAVYLDNLSAGAVAQASALATLAADVTAILADSNELQTDWVNGGRLDLLIDAIKAKTDGLPADPADASDIASSFSTVNSTLSTISTNASTAASAATSAASSSASAASSASTAASAASTAVTQTTGAAIRSAIGLAAANLDTQFGLVATAANLATLAGKFTGITLLARWLGALMGKTADATTLTEIQATQAGAGYDNTTDSLQAIKDSGGGGGGGGDATEANQLEILDRLGDPGATDFNTILATQSLTLETAKKLIEADVKIDKTTNPAAWDMVWYEAGTATELMRKRIRDVNDGAIAATTTAIGRLAE